MTRAQTSLDEVSDLGVGFRVAAVAMTLALLALLPMVPEFRAWLADVMGSLSLVTPAHEASGEPVPAIFAIEVAVATRALFIAGVYFWALREPGAMSPTMVFGFGLLCDLIAGGLIGLTPLSALIVYAVAATGVDRLPAGRPLPGLLVAAMFPVVAIATTLSWWLVYKVSGLAVGAALSPGGWAMGAVLVSLVFPILGGGLRLLRAAVRLVP